MFENLLFFVYWEIPVLSAVAVGVNAIQPTIILFHFFLKHIGRFETDSCKKYYY